MSRVLRIALPVAALVVVVVVLVAAGGSDAGSYRVRAIFGNAFGVTQGLDVKSSGVKIGTIDSLEVVQRRKAAVILNITDPAFQDFRTNAKCIVRPQSLIGERYVECQPTEPTVPGRPEAPELKQIPAGEPNAGQYVLPEDRTSSGVDADLLNSVMKLPYRQRFTLILNELGAGLAGNGKNLREAIQRSDPALFQTDRVLKILAEQNQTLAKLAVDSDEVLAPLARERESVTSFFKNAGETAAASAERSADMKRTLQKLPQFLAELRPTMARLKGLSDQTVPILNDLYKYRGDINTLVEGLGPFNVAGIPAIETLGDAAVAGIPAVQSSVPVLKQAGDFTSQAVPVVKNLSALTQSLQKTGGLDLIPQFLFYFATTNNAFDNVGHFLRGFIAPINCITYAAKPATGCSANFQKVESSGLDLSKLPLKDALAKVRATLGERGLGAPQPATKKPTGQKRTSGDDEVSSQPPNQATSPGATPGTQTSPNAQTTPSDQPSGSGDEPVLDYLFGAQR